MELVIFGAVFLAAGIFGYTYAEQQQDLASQAEDIISGETMDWPLISSLSLAGAVLGLILLVAGIIPQEWKDRAT